MVFASRPVDSVEPLRGPAGRGAEQHAQRLRLEDFEDGADDGGLAGAGAAGDDEQLLR